MDDLARQTMNVQVCASVRASARERAGRHVLVVCPFAVAYLPTRVEQQVGQREEQWALSRV